jgi:peroxiredoxin
MTHTRRGVLVLGATLTLGCAAAFTVAAAPGRPEIGKPAPDFTGRDTKGNAVSLSALRGKTVVLEWTNHECPYVRKHYGSGNMQKLQADAAREGAVWLTLISSAPGAEGHVSEAEADALTARRHASPAYVVLDERGSIGRLYGARTTPHMFVVDPAGRLVYMGGVDNRPTTDRADIEGATNYVRLALDAVKNGEAVKTPISRPYGCSIKYAPEYARW